MPFEDVLDDRHGSVDGDGEADVLCERGERAGRVDPDQLPVDVDERPARVAGVDGRVRLDHVPQRHAPQGRELPAEPGDDPARHRRAAEPERVAERDRVVAQAQARGGPDLDSMEIGRVHADDRQVALGSGAENPAGKLGVLPVGEHDRDAFGVLDDVVVREDGAVLVDDDAGALALASSDEVLEEAPAAAELDADVHERRQHALDHVGERPARRGRGGAGTGAAVPEPPPAWEGLVEPAAAVTLVELSELDSGCPPQPAATRASDTTAEAAMT